MMKADILIKNGHVIDTEADIDGICDVAIRNKMIIRCEKNIADVEAEYVVDASGCIVTPGLIDSHCHFFNWGADNGVEPDAAFLPFGVTTAVDAGSAGITNYDAFSKLVINCSRMKLRSYVNVSPAGIGAIRFGHESLNPECFHEERLIDTVKRHPEVLGLKIRISKDIVEENGLEPLRTSVRIAENGGTVVHVHTTDAPESVAAVLGILRKGDWFSHCYHGTGNCILNSDGKIDQSVFEARDRGVLFDAANGRWHFVWKVAEEAIREGFLPDTISTDLTTKTICRWPVYSLPFIMSKYLYLGVPLKEIVRRVTSRPAELIGMKGQIGTLAPGAAGDVAIFRLAEDRKVEFSDTNREVRIGSKLLIPQMTILDGDIVYRQIDF